MATQSSSPGNSKKSQKSKSLEPGNQIIDVASQAVGAKNSSSKSIVTSSIGSSLFPSLSF